MTDQNNNTPAKTTCDNCGAKLSGRYCSQCAQDSHAQLTVRHLLGEAIEGIAHLDSTVWRTLRPLLFKPGFVTAQYVNGKRKSFAPPVRTYLVISIVYFLFYSLFGSLTSNVLGINGRPLEPSDCGGFAQAWKWLRPDGFDVEASCRRALADGAHVLLNSLSGLLPKVMFVVLPLVALVQYLVFRRQRSLYVENLIFVLHFQSFFFLIGSVMQLAAALSVWISQYYGQTISNSSDAVLYVWSAIYLFIADRRVYEVGRAKAIWGVLALALAYAFFWTLGDSLLSVYTMTHS
jgi:hypothetical protein